MEFTSSYQRLPLNSLSADETKYRWFQSSIERYSPELRYDEDLVQLESRTMVQEGVSKAGFQRLQDLGEDPRVELLAGAASRTLGDKNGKDFAAAVVQRLSRPLRGGVVSHLGQIGLELLNSNSQAARIALREIRDFSDDEGVKAVAESALDASAAYKVDSYRSALKVAAAGVGGEAGPALLLAAAQADTSAGRIPFMKDWADAKEREFLPELFQAGAEHSGKLLAATEAGIIDDSKRLEEIALAVLATGSSYNGVRKLGQLLASRNDNIQFRNAWVKAERTRDLQFAREAAERQLRDRGLTVDDVLAQLPVPRLAEEVKLASFAESDPEAKDWSLSDSPDTVAPYQSANSLTPQQAELVESVRLSDSIQTEMENLLDSPDIGLEHRPLLELGAKSVDGSRAVLTSFLEDGIGGNIPSRIAMAALHLPKDDLELGKQFAAEAKAYDPSSAEKALLGAIDVSNNPATAQAAFGVLSSGNFAHSRDSEQALLQAAESAVSDSGRIELLRAYQMKTSNLEQAAISIAVDHPHLSEGLTKAIQTKRTAELGEGKLDFAYTVLGLVANSELSQNGGTGLGRFFSRLDEVAYGMTESKLIKHAVETDQVRVYQETAKEFLQENGLAVPAIERAEPKYIAKRRQLLRVDDVTGESETLVTLPGDVRYGPRSRPGGDLIAVIRIGKTTDQLVAHSLDSDGYRSLASFGVVEGFEVDGQGQVYVLEPDRGLHTWGADGGWTTRGVDRFSRLERDDSGQVFLLSGGNKTALS